MGFLRPPPLFDQRRSVRVLRSGLRMRKGRWDRLQSHTLRFRRTLAPLVIVMPCNGLLYQNACQGVVVFTQKPFGAPLYGIAR